MIEDSINYTQEELAEKTLLTYYRVEALYAALNDAICAIPKLISEHQPLTQEMGDVLANALQDSIKATFQTEFLNRLSEDPKVSALLRKRLSDELGL